MNAYMTSLPPWVKRRCAKSENPPTQKGYSIYTLTLFLLNFKNILKFVNFTEF